MVAEWPEIRVLVTYGPWLSEPLTARALNPPSIIDGSKANPMYGSFAIGLAEGTIGTKASFIDGGEVYTQATSVDVERTIAWITTGMSEQSSLVPTELRASYRTLVSPSMGIYDFPAPYRGKGPSSPAMWENDIAITLAGVQDFAWVYAERFNWAFSSRDKTRPPPPTEWVEATARGRRTGRER